MGHDLGNGLWQRMGDERIVWGSLRMGKRGDKGRYVGSELRER